jgi:hypothetical protein
MQLFLEDSKTMHLYYVFQILIIFVSAFIPIINLSSPNDHLLPFISSLLGSAIVISTGILHLTKAQENWILFMSTVIH